MIVLGIDTATPGLSVALVGDGGVVGSRSCDAGRRHTETLAPAIEELCRDTGIALAQVDALAVDVGPGLFTGLRVGLATAAALAHALARPVLGVTSTEILAEPSRAAGREVVAVVDVRRGEVAWAHWSADGVPADAGPADAGPADRERDGSPQLATPEGLWDRLVEICAVAPGPVTVVGDGALRYQGEIGNLDGVALDIGSPYPSASVLATLARRRLLDGAPVAPLAPVYLRPADVRIGWASHDLPAGVTTHEWSGGGRV